MDFSCLRIHFSNDYVWLVKSIRKIKSSDISNYLHSWERTIYVVVVINRTHSPWQVQMPTSAYSSNWWYINCTSFYPKHVSELLFNMKAFSTFKSFKRQIYIRYGTMKGMRSTEISMWVVFFMHRPHAYTFTVKSSNRKLKWPSSRNDQSGQTQ